MAAKTSFFFLLMAPVLSLLVAVTVASGCKSLQSFLKIDIYLFNVLGLYRNYTFILARRCS